MLIVAAAALPASAMGDRSDGALRSALGRAGLLPELLARFDVVRAIDPPTVEALMEVAMARLLPGLQAVAAGVGATVELTGQAVALLASAAAASADGGFALQPPLSAIAEEILSAREPARPWVVEADRMRALLGVRESLPPG
jgi:hypothetical protein